MRMSDMLHPEDRDDFGERLDSLQDDIDSAGFTDGSLADQLGTITEFFGLIQESKERDARRES